MAERLPRGVEKISEGRYRARYYGPDGRRHSTETYASASHAEYARNAALGQIASGTWLDPVRSAITLNQWMHDWMPTRLHAGTRGRTVRPYVLEKDWARYRNHIHPYLGSKHLSAITRFTVETWHADLAAAGASVSTIDKAHTLLRTALARAVDDERLWRNPATATAPQRPDRPDWKLLTKPEFERLLAEIPDEWQAVALTAANAGLSWSELAGLRRADYNPLRHELYVRGGTVDHGGRLIDGQPKARTRSRTVPVVTVLAAAIDALIAEKQMAADARLFTDSRGGPIRNSNYTNRVFKPAAVRAGLATVTEQADGSEHYDGLRFHDLRHSFVSWLLNDGVDIHEVKELAGHASVITTELYAHTDKDELRDAMRKALG